MWVGNIIQQSDLARLFVPGAIETAELDAQRLKFMSGDAAVPVSRFVKDSHGMTGK